ncbi:MAG: hypothetical protein IKR01_02315 [Spirochaetales bacterium]|nr:hypothetical protein [Spirochaetales bacterium]
MIDELRWEYPLKDLLTLAGIPRSTFFYIRGAGRKGDKYTALKVRIAEIHMAEPKKGIR